MAVKSKLVIKNIQTPEDIIDVFASLGTIDADFNGDSGDAYLWHDAATKNFTNNKDFLADYVVFHSSANSRKYGIKAYTDKFAKEWRKRDGFYASINIDVVKLDGFADDPNIQGIYAFNLTLIDAWK